MTKQRRAWLVFAGVCLLEGCASTPAPEEPARTRKYEALQALGFRPNEGAWALDLGTRIRFESGSDQLTGDAIATLTRLARALVELDVDSMRIEGHADETGSDAYNLQLSERRAAAVAAVLRQGGMPANGLRSLGLGKRKPIADNHSEAGRAQNRRVVLIVPA